MSRDADAILAPTSHLERQRDSDILDAASDDHERQDEPVKAAYFKEHGGSDKIVYGDYRDPAPAAGEVVVRVKACALNQVDMLLLDGRFPPPEGLPHVNGCEVAGTVETLGAGVDGARRRASA